MPPSSRSDPGHPGGALGLSDGIDASDLHRSLLRFCAKQEAQADAAQDEADGPLIAPRPPEGRPLVMVVTFAPEDEVCVEDGLSALMHALEVVEEVEDEDGNDVLCEADEALAWRLVSTFATALRATHEAYERPDHVELDPERYPPLPETSPGAADEDDLPF